MKPLLSKLERPLRELNLTKADWEVRTFSKGSSRQPAHRAHIRARLSGFAKNRSQAEPNLSHLHNLEELPSLPDWSVSISHCPVLGGFAATRREKGQIGFDLESNRRVSEQIIKYVMFTPEELARAPGPGLLWVAKEATFKSLLGPDQPTVLSQIEVNGWQKLAPEIWQFSAQFHAVKPPSIRGLVTKSGDLNMGICLFRP